MKYYNFFPLAKRERERKKKKKGQSGNWKYWDESTKILKAKNNMEGHSKWACPSVYLKIIVISKSYEVMVWTVTLPH